MLLLNETSEATSLIYKSGTPPFTNVTDFTYIEKMLKSNICLNSKNLIDVLRNFEIGK